MKVKAKIKILKFFLMVINGIFAILGVSVLGCGIWILFDQNSLITAVSNVDSVKIIAGGLFVSGVVVMVISILGCCGTWKEIRCIILLYTSFLATISLGQAFVALLLMIKSNEITRRLSEEVDQTIIEYGTADVVDETKQDWVLLDSMQHFWQCCGRTNYTQWKTNIYIMSLWERDVYPCSCFNTSLCPILSNSTTQRFGQSASVFQVGCQQKIEAWLSSNALVILIIILGLILVQIFQFVLSIYLFRSIRRKQREKQNKQQHRDPVYYCQSNPTFQLE